MGMGSFVPFGLRQPMKTNTHALFKQYQNPHTALRRKEESDKQDDVEKILAVIGAELENVACGLINFKEFLMSLDFSIGSLYEHMPPPLPFTDMLGAKLVLLDKKQVEVLFLLKAKLSTQASYMQ
jgi:hypothetical protein